MICGSCQTTLPEEAIACWKCGATVGRRKSTARDTAGVDPLFAVLTLLISVALFVCLGWAIPFTVWGTIIGIGKEHAEWAGFFDILSGVSFYASAVGVFVGSWWGSYKLLRKLTYKPAAPPS